MMEVQLTESDNTDTDDRQELVRHLGINLREGNLGFERMGIGDDPCQGMQKCSCDDQLDELQVVCV